MATKCNIVRILFLLPNFSKKGFIRKELVYYRNSIYIHLTVNAEWIVNVLMRLVIFISVILLVACQTKVVWLKDGGSPQDLDQDNYQCLQEAQEEISETYISFNGGSSTENVLVINKPLFNVCMEARGWRKCPECDPAKYK